MITIWETVRPDAAGILEDPGLLRAMPRYVRVVKGELPARYLLARKIEASFSDGASDEALLREHRRALAEEKRLMAAIDGGETGCPLTDPPRSLLDLKALIGSRAMKRCRLCERKCRANRAGGELGYCRVGGTMSVSSAFVHMGEEPEIVPSFTVCGQ